jgi:pentatricopeptide repeat protein
VRSTLFSIAISKQASADGARAVFDWFVSHHSPWSSSERKTVNLTPLNHLVESYCREGRLQDAVVLIQRQVRLSEWFRVSAYYPLDAAVAM